MMKAWRGFGLVLKMRSVPNQISDEPRLLKLHLVAWTRERPVLASVSASGTMGVTVTVRV
ncbi:hypothetical protein AGR1A_Cc40246 [Agrobacterium fabacearum CFBP 5771]|nr:hypothetical protein AGR1A_Cc40246 [Agrobacterium fabacearum CFBP 5771]